MEKVLFYTYPSCTSCRKAKKWLQQNGVDFQERHLFRETPTQEELYYLLSLTTDGVDELLATRSQSFKDLNLDIDELSLSQVVNLMVENPKLLRRPILVSEQRLVVGYQPEQLSTLSNKRNLSAAV
ncbi:Spx/MgsR family RNA polymerase-binding regulatory protein [Paenisporosarcina cavernae]|uniref:Spx/MgsR family RNA polymerase-binding regulatory protein n=1 Tax=Paenisporosarcina cavernae TaxID=2320858 RepID=A0A385YSF1_9BACL|nr:Spx/MgsR family RNA polymerase-binding regulatory protein [Paenisporosarcina cavernae]AYC29566.1 Spx/MgsR family RNA polymerase-binding regulatory protein [Paenisporosarcina cavernae]